MSANLEARIAARLAPFVEEARSRQPVATAAYLRGHGAALDVGIARAPEDPESLIAYVTASVVGPDGEPSPFLWLDGRNVGLVVEGEPGAYRVSYRPDPLTDDDIGPEPIALVA